MQGKRAVSRALLLLGVVLLTVAGPDGAAAQTPPKLFGTTETPSANLKPFTKWTGMLARHLAEERRGDTACIETLPTGCPIRRWLEFVETQRDKPRAEQLEAVNRHLNLHRYVLDIVNYGVEDYWATPREFALNDGDCEDYAIAKYVSLKMLGWRDDDLRIVILQDTNLNVAHAVLAAYFEGRALILDNQIAQV